MNHFLISYKWTIYQTPATKSFEHFKQSLFEKLDLINEGKEDLNISPFFKLNGKTYIWIWFDVEDVIEPHELTKNLHYAFSGNGLHIFTHYYTDAYDLLKYREKIVDMFKDTVVDIITTLKTTPFRFMSAFSEKNKIWLHPMINEHVNYAIKVAKLNPFKVFDKNDYYVRVINYFNMSQYITVDNALKLYEKMRGII